MNYEQPTETLSVNVPWIERVGQQAPGSEERTRPLNRLGGQLRPCAELGQFQGLYLTVGKLKKELNESAYSKERRSSTLANQVCVTSRRGVFAQWNSPKIVSSITGSNMETPPFLHAITHDTNKKRNWSPLFSANHYSEGYLSVISLDKKLRCF